MVGTLLGDFNGDGRADILRWSVDYAQNILFLSNGDGSFTQVPAFNIKNTYLGHDNGTVGSLLGDFNGDGKTDILRWWDQYQNNVMYFSNGDGSFTQASAFNLANSNLKLSNGTVGSFVADFDGDGKTDVLRWEDTYANNTVFLTSHTIPDLLASIVNGPGATTTTSIGYSPLTDNEVYAKDNTATYPTVDLQAPLYVVSSYSITEGVSHQMHTNNYAYAGAKADLRGRGFLGFRSTEATSQETSIKARSEFRQDWPYVGLPSTLKRLNPDGSVLSQVDHTYACTAFTGSCLVIPGNRYFAYISQSVEANADLNGAGFPSVVTANQFDVYGNATSITVNASDGFTKTTTNTYTNDAANWILGRLTRSTVASTAPDTPTVPPRSDGSSPMPSSSWVGMSDIYYSSLYYNDTGNGRAVVLFERMGWFRFSIQVEPITSMDRRLSLA